MRVQVNRLGFSLSIALLACLFHTANVRAQTAATIVGDVTDANGAVAPNVTITVIHGRRKTPRSAMWSPRKI